MPLLIDQIDVVDQPSHGLGLAPIRAYRRKPPGPFQLLADLVDVHLQALAHGGQLLVELLVADLDGLLLDQGPQGEVDLDALEGADPQLVEELLLVATGGPEELAQASSPGSPAGG